MKMTATEYETHPGLNWSSLKRMATSPLLFRWRVDHPEPDKDAYALGRAFHCCTLEPERWPLAYARQPDFGDGRTTAAKAAKADWLTRVPPGAEILKAEVFDRISIAAEAVHSHRVARECLSGGTAEEVITWTDAETGVACKGRVDYVRPFGISDLKSDRNIHPSSFPRIAASYLYFGQLAYYHDGAVCSARIPASSDRPVIVAGELDEPFDVACYRMSPLTLEAGRVLYRGLIQKWLECQAAGLWPGCAPDMIELELPPWVTNGLLNGDEADEF